MADSLVLKPRPIYIEDLATNSALAQVVDTVLGIGPIPLTPLVIASSDAAAVAAGLNPGDVYLFVGATPFRLRACFGGGGAPTGGVTKLSGTIASSGETIPDGFIFTLGTTAAVAGIIVGDGILVGSSAPLPTGVAAFGKVVTNGTVAVEIWNVSGATVVLPAITFTVTAFH